MTGPVIGSTSEPTYGSMRAPSGAHDGPMWAHGEALPSRGGMLSPRRRARQRARQLASSYRFVERGASLLAMRPPIVLVFFWIGKAINCCCVASRVHSKLAIALAFWVFLKFAIENEGSRVNLSACVFRFHSSELASAVCLFGWWATGAATGCCRRLGPPLKAERRRRAMHRQRRP